MIREITNGKLGAMVRDARLPVADAGLLGVVRRPRRSGDLPAVGHVGRRQGRAGPDQRRQPRLSAGAVPQRHGAEHGGGVMLTRDEALDDLRDRAGARQGGRRRRRDGVGAEHGRIARALRRQPHHHERARRGPRRHRDGLGRPAARRGDRQRRRRRRAEAAGRRGGADRPRVAGAPRVRADARPARPTRRAAASPRATAEVDLARARRGARGGARGLPHREGDRRRLSQRRARQPPPRRPPTATAATSASSEADFSVTARSADGTGSGYYAGDHFDLARLDAPAHRRAGGGQGRALASSRSRSSRASTPSFSSRRRSPI